MRTLWRLIASFFKWTWRILNFIRKLALNAIFLVLVLVCIGIWSQFSSTTSEHAARGALLLLDITGVVVDKPSASSKLGVIGRQLFGASSDRLQENSLFDIVQTIRREGMTAISPVLKLIRKTSSAATSHPCSTSAKAAANSAIAATGVCRRQQLQPGLVLHRAASPTKSGSPQGEVTLHGFATNGLYSKIAAG